MKVCNAPKTTRSQAKPQAFSKGKVEPQELHKLRDFELNDLLKYCGIEVSDKQKEVLLSLNHGSVYKDLATRFSLYFPGINDETISVQHSLVRFIERIDSEIDKNPNTPFFTTYGFVECLSTRGIDFMKELVSRHILHKLLSEEESLAVGELSEKENKTALDIIRGMFNKEIATKHQISKRTVETRVSNILEKLGVDSRSKIRDKVLDLVRIQWSQ